LGPYYDGNSEKSISKERSSIKKDENHDKRRTEEGVWEGLAELRAPGSYQNLASRFGLPSFLTE
jgi:hypothetical protein